MAHSKKRQKESQTAHKEKRRPLKQPFRQLRNSEKRKEKSRDAARCRRGKESEIFSELASALPLPPQTVAQLDKASVMRLTLAFLKTRALCQAGLSKVVCKNDSKGNSSKLDIEMDALLLKALDGFLLVLSTDGDIVYTSENIIAFLGLPQVDVMGQSLYEYTHPCDHEEVRELMSAKELQEPRYAFLRLKCTLTAKGRSVNLKSASYKVVQVSGEMVGGEKEAWLVALGSPVPHPSNIEFPLDKQTFVSKHSLDMKFTYVDDNVGEFCGYRGEELMGRSLYEMHHALDSDLVKDAYKTLRSKGQVETGRYRFLARAGGYVWLVTQATLIHGPKDHKPQYVVCLNYVVSGVESAGEILSELQLMCNRNSSSNDNSNSSSNKSSSSSSSSGNSSSSSSSSSSSGSCSNNNNNKVTNKSVTATVAGPSVARNIATPTVPLPKLSTQPKVEEVTSSASVRAAPAPTQHPPVAATFKIFAPRTEDMNKGYLMFSDDDPQCTVLKEEPDDLTHLAPSVGDTYVPLLEVPNLISSHDDTGMLHEVSTLIPELDDMFTFDYQMPISSSDVLISTEASDNSEDQEESQKYIYDENKLISGVKCMNSLSGGKILIDKSGCSTPSSVCGISSPEPPKPLLSQAALFPPQERKQSTIISGGSQPRTATEALFTHLDEIRSSDSFGKLDLKLEEQNMDSDEFEMRAPYIPFTNEMLMLSPDDLLWGAESEPLISPKHTASSCRDAKCCQGIIDKNDSNLAQLLRDTDPAIGLTSKLHLGNSTSSQRSQYQQNKFDGGGDFVDPNKVLPGHTACKDDLDGSPSSTSLLDPPPVMVLETVDPPPPLLTVDTHLVSVPIKRGHSPNSSPLLNHKKLCSPTCQRQHLNSQQQHQDGSLHQQLQSGGLRLLETPHAPTMQQLLISKEPITVRGGRPGGGISASQNVITNKSHSVLRNLLVSGRDETAGYSVSAPASPAGTSASSTTSPDPQTLSDEAKGRKNVNGDGSIVIGEHQAGGSGLTSTTVRLPRDKMATMLLAGAGGINDGQLMIPKVRLVTGSHGALMQAGHFALKLATNPNWQSGQGLVKRGRRQDPLLLMDPETTIPNLLDLTQQDYEWLQTRSRFVEIWHIASRMLEIATDAQ
ncbi:protein similar isoform X4 [Cherax quadricarinatus]